MAANTKEKRDDPHIIDKVHQEKEKVKMNIKEAYKKIEDLESKLLFDLESKAYFPSQNFQAYADFARGYLEATGREVDYSLVERAVRDSEMMKSIHHELDKVKYSYNDLVREIATARRDSIAKDSVTDQGADDIHTLKDILRKYGINPELKGEICSKAEYIIRDTRKGFVERKYWQRLIRRREWLVPDNMSLPEFIFLINGYATSTVGDSHAP